MKFATRLNSFKSVAEGTDAILRAVAGIEGIDYVDLNYPEHFDRSIPELKALLAEMNLTVNSVAMRFRSDFVGGEFTNADPAVRREAIELTKKGMDAAAELGADSLTVWLGFDGYDYTFQKDYAAAMDMEVAAYQEIADHNPALKISIEYKPYEERVFALVPNGGITLNVLDRVNRPNMGMTLDFCHQLMANEQPAFIAALALAQDRLFGIHLNDGHGRTDDGLMIGSVHPFETVELVYYLLRHNYDGVIYFDTFPIRENPVEEARKNVETLTRIFERVQAAGVDQITKVVQSQDGIQSQALRNALV
ncbi:sugar phosphate isomerase/epimerase family protein [Luteococcus sp. H138]|uniref:sugar phosphate isomerase/epimerase family protein n=1 Tax=unclassified Luteococcus TaxID=2639923 RepID=UPI00313AD75A